MTDTPNAGTSFAKVRVLKTESFSSTNDQGSLVVQRSIPYLLAAALNETAGLSIELNLHPDVLTSSGENPAVQDGLIAYTVESSLYGFEDEMFVELRVFNASSDKPIFRNSTYFSSTNMVNNITELGRQAGAQLRQISGEFINMRTLTVGVLSPFENLSDNDSYDYLETVIPDILVTEFVYLEGVDVRTIDNNDELTNDNNDELTNERDATIVVSGTFELDEDRAIVNLKFIETDTTTSRLSIGLEFESLYSSLVVVGRRVQEYLEGRITRSGTLRDAPELFSRNWTSAEAEVFRARALEYAEAKDPAAAILMYRLAVSVDPSDMKSRQQLAELYSERGQSWDAVEIYRELVDLEPDDAKLRFNYGQALDSIGNTQSAMANYGAAIELADDKKVRFEAYREIGRIEFFSGNYDSARENYYRAAEEDSSQSEIFSLAAQAAIADGETDAAFEFLADGLNRFPEDANLQNDLASAYNEVGTAAYDQGNYEEALENFLATTEIEHASPLVKAEALNFAGYITGQVADTPDIAKSLEYFEQSYGLNPYNEWTNRALGFFYAQSGKTDKAIRHYEEAIAISPSYFAFEGLGTLYQSEAAAAYAAEDKDRGAQLKELAISNMQSAALENPAWGYVYLGQLHHEYREFDLAQENFELALEADPANEWARRNLGNLFLELRKFELSSEEFRKAKEIEDSPEANLGLAMVFHAKQEYEEALKYAREGLAQNKRYDLLYEETGAIYAEMGRPQEYGRLLKRVVRDDPTYLWATIELANVQIANGDSKEAIKNLKKAVNYFPADPSVHARLGAAYLDLGNFEESVSSLETAVALQPTAEYYIALGRVRIAAGHPYDAYNDFSSALDINPRSTDAMLHMRNIANEINIQLAFIEKLRGLIERDPQFYDGHVNLAIAQRDVQRHVDAEESLRAAISIAPDRVWAYRVLGQFLRFDGRYGESVAALRRANEIEPDAWTHVELARSYMFTKDYENGIASTSAALELDPDYVSALAVAGDIHTMLGDKDAAIQAYQRALAIDPKYFGANLSLAEIYRLQDQLELAEKHAQVALDALPNDPDALEALGRVALDQVNYVKARELLTSSVQENPNSMTAYSPLSEAIKGQDGPVEATRVLQEFLEASPDNIAIWNALGTLYHDSLFEYGQAYDIFAKAREIDSENLMLSQNFIEASLTTGKFREAYEMANQMLKNPDVTASSRLSMRLFAVSSLIFQGDRATAFSELGDFLRDYEEALEDYEQTWVYRGTVNFVEKNEVVDDIGREIILRMTDLLESSDSESEQKLQNFKDSISQWFQQLNVMDEAA